MAEEKPLRLKLLVDKQNNRVVFAESGSDFADVLLSFLTIPIGTIVRMFGKQSHIGCMDSLYESLQALDLHYFQTHECKNMLLNPRSTSLDINKDLVVNIDETLNMLYYTCPSFAHDHEYGHVISTEHGAKCSCGKSTTNCVTRKRRQEKSRDVDGVYVKGAMRFMISDDLLILPVSLMSSLTLLARFGIKQGTCSLEEREVKLGPAEVQQLLRSMLLSKTPLTDMFIDERERINSNTGPLNSLDTGGNAQPMKEIDGLSSKKMCIKLLVNKNDQNVMAAEAGEDFSDLLFSFLAFAPALIVKTLGGQSNLGCLDNLYKSAEVLGTDHLLKSLQIQALLLDPKLPPFFKSQNQLLQLEEEKPWEPYVNGCEECFIDEVVSDYPHTCMFSSIFSTYPLMSKNPKFPNLMTVSGGAYMRESAKYMVTDDLAVKPFSSITLLSNFITAMTDVEEQTVSIGEAEAMLLLKAAVISKTVLNDVFYPKKMAASSQMIRVKVEDGGK